MKKTIFLLLIISIIAFLLYSFHLKQSLFYHPDFSRDMFEILRISQGRFTLIGPKLTFGGLYLGPYYYYLFVPIYILSGKIIISVHYFNAFLFAFAIGYFLKKVLETNELAEGLLASLSLLFLPLLITGARNPSNAYTFIPLFSILLTYIYFNKKISSVTAVFLGLGFGIIVNFHFLNIIFFPALIIYLLTKTKSKKVLFLFTLGLLASFLPLILFEIKHSFVMLTNTFINKSYLDWVNNKNLPNGLSGKKNIIANIFFLSQVMKSYLTVNPLIIYSIVTILFLIKKIQKKETVVYFSSLGTLFLISVIIRFQFIPHYLFGIAFFLFFNYLIILLNFKIRWLKIILMVIFIVIELISFPRYLYRASWRTPDRFEQAVNFVIKNKLVNKSNFNVIQLTKENLLATLGFEYRYFFQKNSYRPDSEFQYPQSKELIIFSEVSYDDISRFNSWEAQQFGKKYFIGAKRYSVDNLVIYKITKEVSR